MSEFNEFEPRLKSAKNRFQLSAGLNLETLNTILSETNSIFKPRLKFKPPLKFFKFGLRLFISELFQRNIQFSGENVSIWQEAFKFWWSWSIEGNDWEESREKLEGNLRGGFCGTWWWRLYWGRYNTCYTDFTSLNNFTDSWFPQQLNGNWYVNVPLGVLSKY